MTSTREVSTIMRPDLIEKESKNDLGNNEHERSIFKFRNELTHSLDDDTASSIVSDYTEDDSTKHFDSKFHQFLWKV